MIKFLKILNNLNPQSSSIIFDLGEVKGSLLNNIMIKFYYENNKNS